MVGQQGIGWRCLACTAEKLGIDLILGFGSEDLAPEDGNTFPFKIFQVWIMSFIHLLSPNLENVCASAPNNLTNYWPSWLPSSTLSPDTACQTQHRAPLPECSTRRCICPMPSRAWWRFSCLCIELPYLAATISALVESRVIPAMVFFLDILLVQMHNLTLVCLRTLPGQLLWQNLGPNNQLVIRKWCSKC